MTNEAPEFRLETLVEILTKVETGEASLAEALDLHPAVIGLLVERAIGLMNAGQLAEAEQLFVDLSNVDNLEPMIPFLLGACRAEGNEFPGAVEAYTEALNRLRGDGSTLAQRLLLCRSWALLEMGCVEEARRDLAVASTGEDADLAKQAEALEGQL